MKNSEVSQGGLAIMHRDLTARRRLFVVSYSRYLTADRAWNSALSKAAELVPDVVGKGYWRLGTSNSRLRRLYTERDRALQRMMVARHKLAEAKMRHAQRLRKSERVALLLDLR